MDPSTQKPSAPGLQQKSQYKSRWLQPHVDAHISIGPEFQASIPDLIPQVAQRLQAANKEKATKAQQESKGPQ